jgi:hypothetical protein
MTREEILAQQEAIESLRAILPPGSMVTYVLRSVSRSGMTRHIDFYYFGNDGSRRWLSRMIADACGYRQADDGSIVARGCGMDIGFSVVYNLASELYPDGFMCTGNEVDSPCGRCPSNDHFNGDCKYTQHLDGGYALRSERL